MARSKLDLAIEKAISKLETAKTKWVADVSSEDAFDAYVDGIAATDPELDPNTVKRSAPAINWKDFATNADKYADIWYNKAVNGFKKKWKSNYVKAFSTPVSGRT